MNVRFATRDDLVQWFGAVPATMRALVAERDGQVLAIAGISTMDDHVQAFSAYRPEMAAHRFTMARMARRFAAMLSEVTVPVLAVCSKVEPTAPDLLARMGFEGHGPGEVWRRG